MEKLIMLVGDSVQQLRAQDVFRLLDWYYGTEHYSNLVAFVKQARPDLIHEIEEVESELA